VYHFKQLAAMKHWGAEDKFLNTSLLLKVTCATHSSLKLYRMETCE